MSCLPSQALRAPGQPHEVQHAFCNDAIFLPEDLGPGTGRNGGAQSGGKGLLVMIPSFCLRTVTLAPSRAPAQDGMEGCSRGQGLLAKKCAVWESQVAWVNPDTPRCIGCCSAFQESDLEATNDQSLFVLTNICRFTSQARPCGP